MAVAGKKKESPVYGMVDEMGRTYNNVATLLGLLSILLMKLLPCGRGLDCQRLLGQPCPEIE